MNKTKKIVMVSLVIISCSLLVSAGLIPHFGKIQTKADVKQSVTINGHPYNEPIKHILEDASGGCCYTWDHIIENSGCEGIWLDWDHQFPVGVTVSVYEPGSCCDHYLEKLDLRVLDGMAEYDDFDAYVDDVLVYSYEAQGGDEDWLLHSIDLSQFMIQCCGTHTVEIVCASADPWSNFDPYGQLAVDTISLFCEDQVLCDTVDIGNPISEMGHNLLGWGPIEPLTSGGGYGGIDDCRCTWYPLQVLNGKCDDDPGASVELTCEDCYEPEECDCGHESMVTPFYLESGDSLEVCYTIYFDMAISPGLYTIVSDLVPAEEP